MSGPGLAVGRSYTRARTFPWVVGKIQGWTIPLGPYTATQIGVLVGGMFLIVKTFGIWSHLGALALPVIATPFLATWAVRHATIEGRTPMRALAGYATLLTEHPAGRIGTRAAGDPRPAQLSGTLRITALPGPGSSSRAVGERRVRGTVPAGARTSRRPATGSPAASTGRSFAAGLPLNPVPPPPVTQPSGRTRGSHPQRPRTPAGAARPRPTGLQALLSSMNAQQEEDR